LEVRAFENEQIDCQFHALSCWKTPDFGSFMRVCAAGEGFGARNIELLMKKIASFADNQ
jgi:hypothetical protein